MMELTPMPGVLRRDKHRCFCLNEEQRQWFEDAVRNFPMCKVAAKMGICDKTVLSLINRLGLQDKRCFFDFTTYFQQHPEELRARNEKIRQRRNKLVRRERFNLRMGLHQESNLYISDHGFTHTDYVRRFRLLRAGYIIPRLGRYVTDDPKVFYFDGHTRRSKVTERHMVAEGYSFRPLSSKPSAHASCRPVDNNLREWML